MIVVRVDDVGWNTDHEPDPGLKYFRAWRDAAGWERLPIVYGVIPACLDWAGVQWMKKNLGENEEVALHGWNHANGLVYLEDYQFAYSCLVTMFDGHGPRAIIPPYNRFNDRLVQWWTKLGDDKAFFCGPKYWQPHFINDMLCLYSHPQLYGKAPEISNNVNAYVGRKEVRVLTLHPIWDHAHFAAVRDIRDQIADDMIGLDQAREICQRSN